ncbi:MAG TPA: carboxypeptidase-like regulatory domain-containing protein [Pyrinomonadaceae bacterium]|jgi:hypothetical protein
MILTGRLKNLARPACAIIVCTLWLCVGFTSARAQGETAPTTPAPRPQGSITGRVVGDDGQPLAGVVVYANSLRQQHSAGGSDAEGKFTLNNLDHSAYTIGAYLAGYYDPSFLANERGARAYYHPGDTVTIKLSKGGVITGRVRDASGEPLIAVRVRALRVRDAEGRPLGEAGFSGGGPAERATDDRGVYRLYGLPPGVYVVAAGGRGAFDFNPRPTAYDDDAPTFYPSTTRDGAAEVILQNGQEATDIDIRYRGEPGRSVSGTVEGGAGEGPVNVLLSAAGNPLLEGFRYLSGGAANLSFVFNSLADGDYDLVARRLDGNRDFPVAAANLRVSVRGADVTGLKLTLTPLAGMAGRVVLEAAPPGATWAAQCQTKPAAFASDTVIRARRERDARGQNAQPGGGRTAEAGPDEKGEFALRGLWPGRFRFDLRPPTPDWYVRAATLTTNAPVAGANMKPPALPARTATVNPLAEGVTLKGGTQISGLTFTFAPGAAALGGRVTPAQPGATLPDLRLYLVPVERERAEDPLRYAVARLRSDGTFAFANLAPGRYHLIARPAAPGEPTPTDDDAATWPTFPDAQTRAQLRRDADTTAATIELQPCQRLNDYALRYTP